MLYVDIHVALLRPHREVFDMHTLDALPVALRRPILMVGQGRKRNEK